MSRQNMDRRDLELLERVLDVYGADRDRWPAADRLRLARLVAESGEARRMLREAAALDRLIDMAPSVAAEREAALAARIVARARTTPRLAGSRPDAATTRFARAPVNAAVARFGRIAPAVSLLAAALVLGIFTGWKSGDLYPGLRPAAVETADATDAPVLADIVFGEAGFDPIEEEFL